MEIIEGLSGMLGQPVDRLIQAVQAGIGKIYEPTHIKKIAAADADAAIINAEAQAKVTAIQAQAESEKKVIEWQTAERIKALEERRQNNINKIVNNAISQLPEQIDTEKTADQDWVSRFFNISQDINNEEMQLIWGKILAGEVSHPNSYSLRTLDLLKNLTQSEAKLFSKVGKFAITDITGNENFPFIIDPDNGDYLENEYGILFTDLLTLRDANLLTPSNLSINFENTEDMVKAHFKYAGKYLAIEKQTNPQEFGIPIVVFTSIGKELLQLLDITLDIKYFEKFASLFLKHDFNVYIGDFVGRDEKKIYSRNIHKYNPQDK